MKPNKQMESSKKPSPEDLDHTHKDKKAARKESRKVKEELVSEDEEKEPEDSDNGLKSKREPDAIKADIEAEADLEVTKSFQDLVRTYE